MKIRRVKSIFSVYDLVLLAMICALSIAVKAIAGTLVRLITGPLGIPGGALAGGFYMLFLTLAIALVRVHGSALMVGGVQIIVLLATGMPGSHGIWTILTYFFPAVAVETVFLFVNKRQEFNMLHFLIGTAFANIVGTFGSNLLFYRLSLYPLLFTLLASALSGAVGGVIAYFVTAQIKRTGLQGGDMRNRTEELDRLIKEVYSSVPEVKDEK